MEIKHWFRREQTQTWKGKGKTSEHQEEAKLNIDCIFLLQGEMLGIRQYKKANSPGLLWICRAFLLAYGHQPEPGKRPQTVCD